MAPAGTHCLLELYDCPTHKLDDVAFVVQTLREAAEVARSTLLREVHYRFTPQGVTALALLAESHISVHTWPERSYAAVDIFTCGEATEPEQACELMRRAFGARRHALATIARGEHAAAPRELDSDMLTTASTGELAPDSS